MNMQQMMMQAQKMQRELEKAKKELHEKEFSVTKAGIVKVCMTGDKQIVEIDIDKDAFNPEDKEMIEETLIMAINELTEKINAEESTLEEQITGRSGGLGF